MSATLTVPSETIEKEEAATDIQTEATTPEPDLEERIRARAYELYEQRQGEPGDPDDDWYRAEAEINGARGTE